MQACTSPPLPPKNKTRLTKNIQNDKTDICFCLVEPVRTGYFPVFRLKTDDIKINTGNRFPFA